MIPGKKTLLAASSLVMPAAALAVYLLTGPSPAKAFGCVCYYGGQTYSPGSIVVVQGTNPTICLTCAEITAGCSWSGNRC